MASRDSSPSFWDTFKTGVAFALGGTVVAAGATGFIAIYEWFRSTRDKRGRIP